VAPVPEFVSPDPAACDVEGLMSDPRPSVIAAPAPLAAVEGDFDETFLRLLPAVKGLCWRILGNETAAEDAAAEAFTRALVRWRRLQSHPNRDAWIQRVATNVSLDVLRKQRREGARAVEPSEAGVVGTPAGPVLDVDVRRALASLPRRQREVVVLRHVVGLSEEETAHAMEVSVNTVKTHGARAMAALRSNTNLDLEGGMA
jgi:RNA polymerase sigma factor (sigma-70 family)